MLSIIPAGALDPVLAAGAAGHACLVNEDHGYRQMLDESAVDLIVLGYYPRPSGGFWWSSASRTSLAERARCCILVAVDPTP